VPSLVVVSNREQRTFKYLLAIATSTLTLHYNWIRHCVDQKCILPYKPYQLPACRCLFTSKPLYVTETRTLVLEGWTIYIHAPKEFQKSWRTIIDAAGGNSVSNVEKLIKNKNLKIEGQRFILAALSPPSKQILELVDNAKISKVSIEWIIQCLSNQEIQEPNAHHLYSIESLT